jgi:hypothetical protein
MKTVESFTLVSDKSLYDLVESWVEFEDTGDHYVADVCSLILVDVLIGRIFVPGQIFLPRKRFYILPLPETERSDTRSM